jgi:tripartite-type tricarboxylate transporter receptor subunit TctC
MGFKPFSRGNSRPPSVRPPKLLTVLMLFASLVPCASFAQGYPSKLVRYIVRAPPGGTDDLIARLMQPALSKALGQSVVIDYRPGAGGLVAWEYLSKQPPDWLRARRSGAMLPSIRSAISLGCRKSHSSCS